MYGTNELPRKQKKLLSEAVFFPYSGWGPAYYSGWDPIFLYYAGWGPVLLFKVGPCLFACHFYDLCIKYAVRPVGFMTDRGILGIL